MSKRNEAMEKLKELITKISPNVSCDDIGYDTSLIDDLMFDSIMMMELVVEVEEAFDIEIAEEELVVEKIGTLEGLLKLVCGEEENE